jgi:hypothetical protein
MVRAPRTIKTQSQGTDGTRWKVNNDFLEMDASTFMVVSEWGWSIGVLLRSDEEGIFEDCSLSDDGTCRSDMQRVWKYCRIATTMPVGGI